MLALLFAAVLEEVVISANHKSQIPGLLEAALTKLKEWQNDGTITSAEAEHSRRVLETIDRLREEEPHAALSEDEIDIIKVAACFHDTGLGRTSTDASEPRANHTALGAEMALAVVDGSGLGVYMASLLQDLIEHHDTTIYNYPWATRDGRPECPTCSKPVWDSKALHLLREADALAHVSENEIQRHIQEWLDSGIPRVGLGDAPLAAWMWSESVAGNLRLLGKRALVDAKSTIGLKEAKEAYKTLEQHVRSQCSLTNVIYEEEVCHADWREDARVRLAGESRNLTINRFHPWRYLEKVLRACSLKDNPDVHPYRDSSIRTQVLPLAELSPMALYLSRESLRAVQKLQDELMLQYCLSLWDLPGLLHCSYADTEVTISPPIVERYTETAIAGHPLKNGILDGLHRCCTALGAGLESVRVAVVSDVPYPPLPKPVSWGRIDVFDAPPAKAEKRELRYRSVEAYPDQDAFKARNKLTMENYQYYLYRDLRSTGSQGPRQKEEASERED